MQTQMQEAMERAIELRKLRQKFRTINMKESTFSEADFVRMLELEGHSKSKIEKMVAKVHEAKPNI